MSLRPLAAGFIAPCLPTKTDKSPSGGQWLHEIKHDGFRIIARKEGPRVRLYSRPGDDLTSRFPLIVETLARLRSRSCIIDGEVGAGDESGVASFDLFHSRLCERNFMSQGEATRSGRAGGRFCATMHRTSPPRKPRWSHRTPGRRHQRLDQLWPLLAARRQIIVQQPGARGL